MEENIIILKAIFSFRIQYQIIYVCDTFSRQRFITVWNIILYQRKNKGVHDKIKLYCCMYIRINGDILLYKSNNSNYYVATDVVNVPGNRKIVLFYYKIPAIPLIIN